MVSQPNENSLWAHSAVPPVATERFSGDATADVLIIGGGFTGLSAALHIAESGGNVILLEAMEFGFGGSGRNAGLVNPGVWLTPQEVDQQLGRKDGDKLNNALGRGPEEVFGLVKRFGMSCEALNTGTIYVAHSAAKIDYLKQRHAQMAERGATCEILSGEETARLTGSPLYRHAGLLDPRAGTIQPLSYAREMARAAQSVGAKLHQKERVQGLRKNGGKWLAKLANGSIAADQVILATNAYSDAVVPETREATIPVGMFQVATDILPPEMANSIVPERHGVWDTRLVMLSTRIDAAGRLVMCSAGSLAEGGIDSLRPNWTMRARDRVYPQLRGVKWSYHWSGTVGFTTNHLPRVHIPEPGLIVPIGYNGRGIGPGTVIGKACATMVLGGPLADFPLPQQALKRQDWRLTRSSYYEFGSAAAQLISDRF